MQHSGQIIAEVYVSNWPFDKKLDPLLNCLDFLGKLPRQKSQLPGLGKYSIYYIELLFLKCQNRNLADHSGSFLGGSIPKPA
jgi:hypothetical protein